VRFERVHLRNFKCYADTDLRLEPGVTVVHGLNGSGKSTLLEACFFALYGSAALDVKREEVITTGEEECEVELWFAHAGGDYHIERRLKDYGDRVDHDCLLETPDGTHEGARDVEAAVADLLRMDAEAFTNCAYVQQGEVNKLINATPTQRQAMIDDLLQLGKLEEYRERASRARLGVEDVLSDRRGRLSELAEQIEAKEEKDLHDRLNAVRSELNEVETDIERFEENRDRAEGTLSDAEAVLETHKEKREALADLAESIEDLRETIAETERERETCRERLHERRERVEELEAERDDLLAETALSDDADRDDVGTALAERREARDAVGEEVQSRIKERQQYAGEADALAEAADDLESRVASEREEAAELEEEVAEGEESLAERRERIDDLEDDIEERRAAFTDAPVEFGEAEAHLGSVREERESVRDDLADLRATLGAARERVLEAEELLAEGNCPECGQPVEGAPHVDSLDEDRERVADLEEQVEGKAERLADLEERVQRAEALVEAEDAVADLRSDRESAESLLSDREEMLAEKRERAGTLREEADELAAEAAEKREAAVEKREQAEAKREAIAECNGRQADLKAEIADLEELRSVWDDLAEARSTVEDLTAERERLAELNDERRERLADQRERRAELEAEFDEESVEEARAEKQTAEEYLEKVREKLEDLRAERDDLQGQVGGIENELDELADLREKHEALADRVASLESLHEEAEELQAMYGDLRAELRQRNVESLERMLNETFDLVYQNDSYARIELDGEYELTVYQKDGEPLDPEQLSGGERALFNLSLRCAIYRLLVEGIEGAAPMPPLILDEPTVFLDSGHVSKLVELVEAMRDLGVEQIVVVSHDDELVGAADDLVTVRKDSTTNRSSVEHERAVDRVAADD